MALRRYAPWSGPSGVVETVSLATGGTRFGVLNAQSQSASCADVGGVTSHATLAAVAQAAQFAGACKALTHGTLSAADQAAIFAGTGTSGGSPTPLSIFGSLLAWWVRADDVVLGTGSDVAQLNDKSGNGRNFTGHGNPQLVSNALNSQPGIALDGIDDYFSLALARAAPGTQPIYVCLLVAQITWTINDTLYHDGGGGLFCSSTTPRLAYFNGSTSANNANGTLNTYRRIEFQLGNSASDYLNVGATTTTGALGNAAGTGTIALAANPAPSAFANVRLLEAYCYLGTATKGGGVGQRDQADTYITSRYGAGLV